MSKCTACGDKPENTAKDFTKAVIEINNPETLVLLRKVVIPASMGDDTDVVPAVGKYHNVLLQYEANGHIYLYSSDGIPTAIEANIPQEVLDRIDQLEIDVDLLETGLANETTAREAADSALSSSIESLSSSLSAETAAREQADAALEGSINNLTADLEEEATARETADTALGGRIDAVADNLATETANRISADEGLQADITAEATARQNADATLQNNITAEATARENGDAALNTAIASETTARQEADTNLQNQIAQEAQARAAADTAINGAITSEATARQTADAGLQSQIDAITAGSDVKDIVGTKAELNNYDTSTLGDNDIVKVLQDESENNATTYYRWNAATQQFTLIGEEGPYYTKSQTDTLLNAKQNTLTAGSNVQIVNDTISATDTTYTAGTGLALNGTQFSVDTTTVATQSDLTAGLATKQDTLTAGTNIQINNNTISATDTTYTAGTNVSISSGNVISATDTTYSDFTGTDGTAAGTAGLVPAPATTDAGKFLKADGTWDTAGGGGAVIELTSADYNYPTNNPSSVALWLLEPGVYTTNGNVRMRYNIGGILDGRYSLFVIGEEKGSEIPMLITGTINSPSGVIVQYLKVSNNGTSWSSRNILDSKNIVASLTSTSNTDVLAANQGKALKDLIDSLVVKNAGAPTTSTVGTVGQLLEDTTNGDLYICTDATNPYVWEEVGAGGGSGPTVVQTTGTSTTDVMSQNATTSLVYADPATRYKVKIGYGSASLGDDAISIGRSSASIASRAISIGYSSSAGERAIAIGGSANASGNGAIALGFGALAQTAGQVSVGTSYPQYGYNNSAYRLISGVYDGQSAHDAATKGQLDSAVSTIEAELDAKQDVLTAGQNITIAEESGALVISATGGSGADVFTTNEWDALWA